MIRVIGAGPAGAMAAITALRLGSEVELVERARGPRHKVCGEFLSPEVVPLLESAGLLDGFRAENPAVVRRFLLHFGRRAKRATLPEPAFGLSRYRFDRLLFEHALAHGARWLRAPEHDPVPTVIATGRSATAPRGTRTFGFKAHFRGPPDDAVELFFFDGCYVGVNAVEDGITNVCGLAPERALTALDFDIDRLLGRSLALSDRLRPLGRMFDWLITGPLVYRQEFGAGPPDTWLAGDRLSFVDPFTGSGLLSALVTGRLAGRAAADRLPPATYLRDCRRVLAMPFQISSVFRQLALSGWAERLVGLVPGRVLFHLTRPRR